MRRRSIGERALLGSKEGSMYDGDALYEVIKAC